MKPNQIVSLTATVYEFKDHLYVLEESQQGKDPLPETSYQRPGELRALTAKLAANGPTELLGKAARQAINNYDIEPPKYDPWESPALRKQLVGWLGARGFATIVKNSRRVNLSKELATGAIKVFPSDNHQSKPWYGMQLDNALVVDPNCTDQELGAAILDAFARSTYHPDRTDPPAA